MNNRPDKLKKTPYDPSGMKGEMIFSVIERDIGLTFLIIAGGLLYSKNGTRGFPVPWIGYEGISTNGFLISAAIIFFTVLVFDLLMSVVNRRSEPTASQNASFSEVPAVNINSYDDSELRIKENEAVTKVRPVQKKTAYRKPMLNGVRPGSLSSKEPSGNSMSMVTFVVIIALIAVFSASFVALSPTIDDSDWYEDEEYYDNDTFAVSSDIFDTITNSDTDSPDPIMGLEISQDEWDAFNSVTDWSETNITDELYYYYSDNDDRLISYYRVSDNNDDHYILAFNYLNSITDDSQAPVQLLGISAWPDIIYDRYDGDYGWYDYEEADWADICAEITSKSKSIGDTTVDGNQLIELFTEYYEG